MTVIGTALPASFRTRNISNGRTVYLLSMVLQLVLPRKRPISINAPLAARYLAPESITQSLRRIRAVVVPPELLPTIEGLAIAVGLAASENNVIKVRCASDGADVEVDTWFVQWGCWERPLIQVRIA